MFYDENCSIENDSNYEYSKKPFSQKSFTKRTRQVIENLPTRLRQKEYHKQRRAQYHIVRSYVISVMSSVPRVSHALLQLIILSKCLKDEIIDLKIKIDGGLSRTVEGFYLHKQFRSMVAERGYNVDETYESSVQCPENNKIDPYINLAWRLNMALLSFQNKYSSAKWKMIIVFVDKSLESVLKDIHFTPLAPIEPRIYVVGDSSMDEEKKEE
ncbi:hypothetical protein T02_10446 [Trichinella nativa]|uniref:Uncharacterized protein n=1 Tax=Trichinella nativa TaxID=6335 RepID=A0A0V1L2R4_9BILA|nr:hypothetical protein T02_10446 [Trichinella nativa]